MALQGNRNQFFRKGIVVPMALLLATAGLISMPASASGKPANKSPITIGAMYPISGALGAFAATEGPSIALAVKQINAKGGVLGRKLKVVTEDTLGTSVGAVQAWDLLATHKPVAILGPILTAEVQPLVPLANTLGIPVLHAAVTGSLNSYEQGSKWFFRVAADDLDSAQALVTYANGQKLNTAPAIFSSSDELGASFQTGIEETLGSTSPVAVENAAGSSTDFTPQILALKAANPSVIYLSFNAPQVATFLTQATQLGLNVPVFALAAAVYAVYYFSLTPISNVPAGSIFANTAFPTADPQNPGAAVFTAALKAATGKTADSYAADWYSTVFWLASAIQKAGTTKPGPLKKALEATRGFQLYKGIRMPFPPFSCDPEQNCANTTTLNGVKNGSLSVVTTVEGP